jgi:LAS superfamily LD-carboxypeptidase LdcB
MDVSGERPPGWKWKYLALIVLGVFLIGVGASSYALFTKPNHDRLNLLQRCLVRGVVDKWERQVHALPEEMRPVVDYDLLLGELNPVERWLIKQIFAINPRELGFKDPFHSLEKSGNLVKIAPRTYKLNGQEKSTGSQYCPETSYNDFLRMMAQMRQDLGRELFIDSGYRSPGWQAYNFLCYLAQNHDYSLRRTARLNALPGYSEHQDPVDNALDFINAEGVNGEWPQTPDDFEKLPEYQWLLQHAHEFNFHLSYPRNNQLGISFEPWHWHWQKPGSANPATDTK